jgi:tetratricopeptide (TPR) repeat protein
MSALAQVLRFQGKYTEAEQLLCEALVVGEDSLVVNHPLRARSEEALAAVMYAQGRHEAAVPLYEQAYNTFSAALSPEHPDTQDCLHNLKSIERALEEERKAEAAGGAGTATDLVDSGLAKSLLPVRFGRANTADVALRPQKKPRARL